MKALSPEEAFVAGQFTEAHEADGSRIDLAPEAEAALLEGLPLVEIEQ
jgi:hypothetical protein